MSTFSHRGGKPTKRKKRPRRQGSQRGRNSVFIERGNQDCNGGTLEGPQERGLGLSKVRRVGTSVGTKEETLKVFTSDKNPTR